MHLTGVHLLLTYTCTFECDHCFVWGGPQQQGTMTLDAIRTIVGQARDLKTVEWIYFEGGEPFLYFPTLSRGVKLARDHGFKVGIVSNTYWATSEEDAVENLRPFVGLVDDLTISSDDYQKSVPNERGAEYVAAAATKLGIPLSIIGVEPTEIEGKNAPRQLETGISGVMYRGRAAVKLAPSAPKHPWESFDSCVHEDLANPSRVHIDPLGYVHVCQGIAIGNVFEETLADIDWSYDPITHPIVGPLITGGPAELARQYDVAVDAEYADECHLCYSTRCALRDRFPEILAPDQMYGGSPPSSGEPSPGDE